MNRVLENERERYRAEDRGYAPEYVPTRENEPFDDGVYARSERPAYAESMRARGFDSAPRYEESEAFVQPEFLRRAGRLSGYAEARPAAEPESDYYARENERYVGSRNYYGELRRGAAREEEADIMPGAYAEADRAAYAVGDGVREAEIYRAKPEKKKNARIKLLIAVYFFIVAVIATLLLVNMALGGNSAEAAREQTPVYNTETVGYAVDADGNVIAMEERAPVVAFGEEEAPNWFEKLCGAIEKIAD